MPGEKSKIAALPLLTQTLGLLRRYNLRARKGLGQHFLIDDGILEKVVTAAELTPSDTVVEIGPGLGVLTTQLAQRTGRVIAIELDDTLASILKERLASHPNVTIINEDVLNINPAALVGEASYKVVANLPYYITSPVLRHFLEASPKPKMMVVMIQREVAEEITAAPGRMSILSISVQLYGKPFFVARVPAESFYPAPKVDSAILKIEVYPRPAVDVDTEGFFRVVKAGFKAARKQIGNSLAQGLELPKPEALALLEKAGIDSQRRAETLTLEEWARLWGMFAAGEVS